MEAVRPITWTAVRASSIKSDGRHRKDMGDLQALADSIKEVGLLQPIGVTSDKRLVFGERRLRAMRDILGRKQIPAVIVDLDSIVSGEYAENEIRKDFTLSERDSIRRAIEQEEKEKAKERQRLSEGRGKKGQQNSADLKQPQSRSAAAKRVGLGSHDTASKVAKVVDKGTPELVAAMDTGALSVNAAAKLVELPKVDQAKAAKAAERGEKKTVKNAVKQAEQAAKPDWARGDSPKAAAKKSPAVRWSKLLHDIYVVQNSVRDLGGMAKLTEDWDQAGIDACIDELREIVATFEKWIEELE